MSDRYNEKSCSALEKSYYRPIEAALRWCNLIQHEVEILKSTGDELYPGLSAFPQWPCLRVNAEKIYDATLNGELLHGRDGRTVSAGDQVAKHRLTIRHTDLKAWMAKHYPDQKPKFLFDETERITHAAINADSFRALQADRDALKLRVDNSIEAYRKLKQERDHFAAECDSLRKIKEKMAVPGERAETTYLNIIGGLLGLILGKTAANKRHSNFENQRAIIDWMLANYTKPGISIRTLEAKFSEAKQSLKD